MHSPRRDAKRFPTFCWAGPNNPRRAEQVVEPVSGEMGVTRTDEG